MSLPSQAAVIVTFEQSGSDVIARWDGTLDPGQFWDDVPSPSPTAYGFGEALCLFPGSGVAIDIWSGGVATPTDLLGVPTDGSGPVVGFYAGDVYYPGADNSAADQSVLTFDGTIDYFTFADVGLNDIGASGFANTLAWTSSSGDTIKYTTVPEAGSALLGLLAMGLGCLIRKRRGV